MKTKLWGWPRFGEQFQKPISHNNMYFTVLFSFLDLQLLLPKKNHHCPAAVVTSDTWIEFARIWRHLQGEVSNKCLSKLLCSPIWSVECYSPGMNADLAVLSFIPLLRDKRKPTNCLNLIPTEDCHLYPLPWFLVPSPLQRLMEPFLEHTRAYGCTESMTRAQSSSGITVDQVILPICAHSDLSRDHCSNSSAGQVFEAMLQRSGPHIFLNLLMGEPQELHKSEEICI